MSHARPPRLCKLTANTRYANLMASSCRCVTAASVVWSRPDLDSKKAHKVAASAALMSGETMVDRGPAEKAEDAGKARLQQLYPTIDDLRRRARRRVPRFGFDFVAGGANEEHCIDRNTDAFQRVELLPHYCIEGKSTTDTE